MCDEYSLWYNAQQGAEPAGEDHWNLFGTDDFGSNIPYEEFFDIGAGQDLANVDFVEYNAQDFQAFGVEQGPDASYNVALNPCQPPEDNSHWSAVNTPGMNLGHGSAVTSWETPHATFAQPTQVSGGSEGLQNTFSSHQAFDHGLTQSGLSNVTDQLEFDEHQFWKDHEEISNFLATPGGSGQQHFLFGSNAEDWTLYEDLVTNGGFSQNPDSGAYDEQRMSKRFGKGNRLQYDASQQHTSYQAGSSYHDRTSYSDISTSVAFFQPFVATTDNSFSSSVGANYLYPGYKAAKEAAGPSNYAISSQTGKTVDSSETGKANKISKLHTNESVNPGNKVAGVSNSIPLFDEVGVVENDDVDEHEDLAEEDAESLQTAQEGQGSITHEEEDIDGTRVVIIHAGGKGWGKIGLRNGVAVYFNPDTGKWQEYLTHDSMRGALIDKAQAAHPGDAYRHPDPSSGGGSLYGVTSFFKRHQNWGPETNRDDLPDCVFKWPSDEETARILSLPDGDDDAEDELRRSWKDYPGPMMWGHRILLDHHNLPVADHDIPATLSGNTPGYKLQAMRLLNPNIMQYDLLARMPRQIQRKKEGKFYVKDLGTKNTHVNMPMQRFRDRAGCIAGARREGSKEIFQGLLKFFRHHGFDPVESGSSRGFGRNLKPWERDEVKLGNAGNYSKRAGRRALPEKQRKEIHDKRLKAIDSRKKKEAIKAGKRVPNARKHIDEITAQPPHSQEQFQEQPAHLGPLEYGEYQAHQLESLIQADEEPDNGAPSKRRRTNAASGAKSKQPRRRRNGKTPQPQHYGARGAPSPLSPPTEYSKNPSVGFGSHANPRQGFEYYPDDGRVFDVGQDNYSLTGGQGFVNDSTQPQNWQNLASGSVTQLDNQTFYSGLSKSMNQDNPSSCGEEYGGLGISPDIVDLNRSDVSAYYSEPFLPMSAGYGYQQTLRRDGRGEPTGPWDENRYASHQDLVEQGPEKRPREEERGILEPKPKRRLIPRTEGYHSPSVQALKAGALRKARKSERDAHLAPPQLHISQTIPELDEATPAKGAHMLHTQRNLDGRNNHVGYSPQVPDSQNLDALHAPVLAGAEEQESFDIRNVRPANGNQSLSVDNALKYTREAFSEWTGKEAPVTNIEDTYNVQYQEIQSAFRMWWNSETNPQYLEPLPELYRMEAWSGGLEDWKAPENMEHLYEPMRRRRWAARNADGSLRQPEFHWNFEDYI